MPDKVILSAAGLTEVRWDGDVQEYVSKLVEDEHKAISRLRCACEIAEGTTLGDIFRVVERHPALVAFLGTYSWCRAIDQFHNLAKRPPTEDAKDVEYLEVCWHASHSHYERGKEVRDSLELGPDFHGVGRGDDGGVQGYAIEFSPVNEIAHLEVRLNTKVEVHSSRRTKGVGWTFSDGPVLATTRTFSLLEVLDAIYWEISFLGSPADVDRKREDLKETIRGIGDGTIETTPWDLDAEIARLDGEDDDG